MPSSIAYALTTVFLTRSVTANLIPKFLLPVEDTPTVEKRCENPCGYYGQVCCEEDQYCYTDANDQAQCGAQAVATATQAVVQSSSGKWEYYVTTYVQTDLQTVTQTYSSFIPEDTLTCSYAKGESACGNCCCLAGEYCQSDGVCVDNGGGNSGYYSSLFTKTSTIIVNTANAPLRPTTQTVVTRTETATSGGTATNTQPYITPVSTDGSIITPSPSNQSHGLSGGAIAGIVIGVILGLILLLLFCACFCFKELLDGLLAIFGLGPRSRRRTEETYIEERRSSRGGRNWFGRGPRREEEIIEEKRTSGWTRGASVAAFLGGLALILGLKRRRDRRDEDKSSVSYDSYSSYTSSESVSDRRSRRGSRSRSRASGR